MGCMPIGCLNRFLTIMSHTQLIISVSQASWGTWNDKSIVTCDATIKEIKTNVQIWVQRYSSAEGKSCYVLSRVAQQQ